MKKLVPLLLIIICASCHSRYWFRDKIRVKQSSSIISKNETSRIDSSLEVSAVDHYSIIQIEQEYSKPSFIDSSEKQIPVVRETIKSGKKKPDESLPEYTIPRSTKWWNTILAVLLSFITLVVYVGLFQTLIVPLVIIGALFFTIYAFVTFQRMRSIRKQYKNEMNEKEKKQLKLASIHTIIGSAIFILTDVLLVITQLAPIGILWIAGAIFIIIGRIKFDKLVKRKPDPAGTSEKSSFLHSPPPNPNTIFIAGTVAILLGLTISGIGLLIGKSGDSLLPFLFVTILFVLTGLLFWLLAVIINLIYE